MAQCEEFCLSGRCGYRFLLRGAPVYRATEQLEKVSFCALAVSIVSESCIAGDQKSLRVTRKFNRKELCSMKVLNGSVCSIKGLFRRIFQKFRKFVGCA